MPHVLANLAMVGAVLLWAASATGNKVALADVSVAEVVAFRILGAAVLLWTLGLAFRRDFRWRGPVPLLMGILEPGLVTFFVVLGLRYTSAVNAAVVWGLLPLSQPLLARLVLREPVERPVLVGALLAVAGTALLFAAKHQDGSGSLLGDLFLVLGVASAASNQLLARHVATTRREPVVTTSYQLLSASVLALLYLGATAGPGAPYAGATAATYALLAFLILTTAGPFFLYNYALQYLPVGRISLFGPLTGPVGVVIATFVFGEPVDALIVAAIALALGGAFLPTLARLRGPRARSLT